MTRLFFDNAGTPILKSAFCMFVDVLGFVDLISEATDNGTADELLTHFSSVFERSSEYWNEMRTIWEYKCFTDNVVFGCPMDNKSDSESEFGAVFTTAGFHQLEMAVAGYFVRGGMCVGPLHIGENMVFGKGCLDAYHLENKVANYPRIVLSENVLEEVYKHLAFYGRVEYSPHNESIFVDDDGRFFLNYLDALIDGASAEDVDFNTLERHRDLIVEKLGKHAADNRIREKYEWLARYHNHVVERQVAPLLVGEYAGDPTPLKVAGHPEQQCKSLSEFMRSDSNTN